MGGRYIHVLDVYLVHKVLADGDGAVFKFIRLGEDPRMSRGRLLDPAIYGDRALDLFRVVEDTDRRASD